MDKEKRVQEQVERELSDKGLNLFDILSHFGILELSIGTALGLGTKDFINDITDQLLLPLIDLVFNIKNLNKYSVKVRNTKFPVGNIIYSFIRFMVLIILIIILFNYLLAPIIRRIITRRNQHNKELIKHVSEINKEIQEATDWHLNRVPDFNPSQYSQTNLRNKTD